MHMASIAGYAPVQNLPDLLCHMHPLSTFMLPLQSGMGHINHIDHVQRTMQERYSHDRQPLVSIVVVGVCGSTHWVYGHGTVCGEYIIGYAEQRFNSYARWSVEYIASAVEST